MARRRYDTSARGLISEKIWTWVQAGRHETAESEARHYGGHWYWLWAIPTHHWHPCFSCGEGIEERLIRLLRIALADGTVGLADEWAVMMDDANVENVIRALDEIEAPPSWEQWKNHYDNECPARKKRLQLEEV